MQQFEKLVCLDLKDFFELVPQVKSKTKKIAKEVEMYSDILTNEKEIIRRIGNADAVFLGWTQLSKNILSKEVLNNSPKLKYVGIMATGFNMVHLEQAKKRGIVICNVPSYSTDAVTEFVFGQLLAFVKKSASADKTMKNRQFKKMHLVGTQLKGKTFGIIGLGEIGFKVAKIANVFGMKVNYWSKHRKKSKEGKWLKYLPLKKLLNESDIISLHLSLNKETENFISTKEFSEMKKKPILINAARGAIVDQKALLKALETERISGSVIDVYPKEPINTNDPILKAKNTLLSPHIAWLTKETNERMLTIGIENAEAFLKGKPQNRVA